MLRVFFFALLAHSVISCQNGTTIQSRFIEDDDNITGVWNYVYKWDIDYEENVLLDIDDSLPCGTMIIELASQEFREEMQNLCGNESYPFEWEDVKFRIVSGKGGVIVIGEESDWMVLDCVLSKISVMKADDDYLILSDDVLDFNSVALLAKKKPSLEELKCLADNIDYTKDIYGMSLCYSNE